MRTLLRKPGDLIVPTTAWITYLFLLVPSLIVIPISFGGSGEMEFPPREWTLDLYRQFFADPSWWGSLVRSLQIAVLVTLVTIILGVPAASVLQRTSLPGKSILSGLSMGPLLVPVVVLALGLYLQLSPAGFANKTWSVVLAHSMLALPFVMVSVGAALRHLDPAYEQVALIMGAGKIRIFFRIVLPQLRSGIAAGALFAFLISLDEVIVAYFITGPETQTLPVKMYSALRWEVSPVIAAVSTILTVISLLCAIGVMWLERRDKSA